MCLVSLPMYILHPSHSLNSTKGICFTVYVVCNKGLTIAVCNSLLYYRLSLNLSDTLLSSISSLYIVTSLGASMLILISSFLIFSTVILILSSIRKPSHNLLVSTSICYPPWFCFMLLTIISIGDPDLLL